LISWTFHGLSLPVLIDLVPFLPGLDCMYGLSQTFDIRRLFCLLRALSAETRLRGWGIGCFLVFLFLVSCACVAVRSPRRNATFFAAGLRFFLVVHLFRSVVRGARAFSLAPVAAACNMPGRVLLRLSPPRRHRFGVSCPPPWIFKLLPVFRALPHRLCGSALLLERRSGLASLEDRRSLVLPSVFDSFCRVARSGM